MSAIIDYETLRKHDWKANPTFEVDGFAVRWRIEAQGDGKYKVTYQVQTIHRLNDWYWYGRETMPLLEVVTCINRHEPK